MRQLGDFAAWLGLILIVIGVVYYTPMLVDYMTDDSPARAKNTFSSRPAGGMSARRNMAMYHHLGIDRHTPGRMRQGMSTP
jgi:hypothetical protein